MRLLGFADRIPPQIGDRMRDDLERFADEETNGSLVEDLFERPGARSKAVHLIARLFPERFSEERLLELLGGTEEQVAAAIRIIGDRGDAGHLIVLVTLANHHSYAVRDATAAELARWVALGIQEDAAAAALERMLQRPGLYLAARVVSVVANHPRTTRTESIIQSLSGHPSAKVRELIRSAREKWGS